jgi:hypothetical protein
MGGMEPYPIVWKPNSESGGNVMPADRAFLIPWLGIHQSAMVHALSGLFYPPLSGIIFNWSTQTSHCERDVDTSKSAQQQGAGLMIVLGKRK